VYRFKAFDSRDGAGDIESLETRVNVWIEQERPRIRLMCQTPVGNHIVLSFVFEVASDIEDQVAKATTVVPDVFQETMEDTPLDPTDAPPMTDNSDTIQ
jgi:hypothetical protein